jgi:hypothetical protein
MSKHDTTGRAEALPVVSLDLVVFGYILFGEKLAIDALAQLGELKAGAVSWTWYFDAEDSLDGSRAGRHDDDAIC